MEHLAQPQSNDIISSKATDKLLAQLETNQPEISQFAKEFQQNLKAKNLPDQNSELVATISVLSEIKDPKQLDLAKLIFTKTNIKPSILAEKIQNTNWSKTELPFLKYYLQKIQTRGFVDKKIALMNEPAWPWKMEWKLKSLYLRRVWWMEKSQAETLSQSKDFDTKTQNNFDAKSAYNNLQIKFLSKDSDEKVELEKEKKRKLDNLQKTAFEARKKILTETRDSETILKQKYSDKIPQKLSSEQEAEALKSCWLTDKKELEDKIKSDPNRRNERCHLRSGKTSKKEFLKLAKNKIILNFTNCCRRLFFWLIDLIEKQIKPHNNVYKSLGVK